MFDQDFVRLLEGQDQYLDEATARQTADAQQRIYTRLLQWISDVRFKGGSVTRRNLQGLREVIATALRGIEVKDTGNGVWRVFSGLPVLQESVFAAWKGKQDAQPFETAEQARRATAFVMAGIIFEGLARNTGAPERTEPEILASIYRYSQVRYWLEQVDSDENDFVAALALLKAESETNAKAIETEREQFRTSITESNANLQIATERADKLTAALDKIEIRLGEKWSGVEARLHDLEGSIREEMQLNTMATLWSGRARQAQFSLWICLVTLVAMSAAAVATVIFFGKEILDFVSPFNFKTIFLSSTAAGALSQHLGRIILVTVPIFIFFWLMKITVRMLIRSLLLMDDARQRQTIMESYFLLIKEGEKDERALPMMLWALFRQVPGHGSDGIEPPDFTEALNAGLKVGPFTKP